MATLVSSAVSSGGGPKVPKGAFRRRTASRANPVVIKEDTPIPGNAPCIDSGAAIKMSSELQATQAPSSLARPLSPPATQLEHLGAERPRANGTEPYVENERASVGSVSPPATQLEQPKVAETDAKHEQTKIETPHNEENKAEEDEKPVEPAKIDSDDVLDDYRPSSPGLQGRSVENDRDLVRRLQHNVCAEPVRILVSRDKARDAAVVRGDSSYSGVQDFRARLQQDLGIRSILRGARRGHGVLILRFAT